MAGIGIVTNPHSRRNRKDPERMRRLGYILGRDDVYETIEGFYDACIMAIGACVIDPLPEARIGERIQPLPLPASARARQRQTEICLAANGEWRTSDGEVLGNIDRVSLAQVWARNVEQGAHGASA